MFAYIFPYCLITFFSITDQKKDLVKREYYYKYAFIVFALYIIILGGIRWEVGSDWNSYLEVYNIIKENRWSNVFRLYSSIYGYGFLIYTFIISHLFPSYSIYLTITAAIIVVISYRIIYKYSSYPLIALMGIFSFSFGYAFSVPRSGLALAFIFQAFDEIQKNKKIKFVLFVMLAISFHNTVLFFVPAYWISKRKLNIRIFPVVISLLLAFIVFGDRIIGLLKNISFLPISITARIQFYTYLWSAEGEFGGSIFNLVIRIFTRGFLVFLIYSYLWNKRDNSIINTIINLYLVSIIIYLMSIGISDVFTRVAICYEEVSQYFIFTESIKNAHAKGKKNQVLMIVMAFFFLKFLSRLFIGYNTEYVPYTTYFGK